MRLQGQRAIDQLVLSVTTSDCSECEDIYYGLLQFPQTANLRRENSGGVAFCCNRPLAMKLGAWLVGGRFPGEFQVKPSLVSLFSDPRVVNITMVLAYIDNEGAEIVRLALERLAIRSDGGGWGGAKLCTALR